MILAIDLGNYNIKTSRGICFPSTFTIGSEVNPIGEEILEYNNQSYTMTKGVFDNEFNKARKDYLPNLLYAIALSSEIKDTEFDLILGVPLDNLGITNNFKEDLADKEFKFKLNGINRKIKINRVATVGEGISSFYTLTGEKRSEPLMIIDIGGRTVNVAVFENKKLQDKFTIPKGVIDLNDDIAARVNSDGNNFVSEQIERLINDGTITDVDVEERRFLDWIMNQINRKVNRNIYKVYYTGGGSQRLKKQLVNYIKPKGEIMDNPLFSNCLGNKIIADVQWGE